MTARRAAVVIPTLDEEGRIGALLAQLSRLPRDLVTEIIVADGGSVDRTREIAKRAGSADPRIRMIANPARIQSAGVNQAVKLAGPDADTIVRIDAHAQYPDDYVPRVLAKFAETGAQMIAVRLDTRGETCLQRAIAAASNSLLGTGGSAHRVGGRSMFVDHGHHAGMDRATFTRVGGYDESFEANEDAEFDVRVRRAGGRIWLAADIEVVYFPRRTFGELFRQYRRYGRGRARNFLKHRERLRVRQLLPPLAVVAVATALPLSLWRPWLLVVPAGYAALLLAATGALAARSRDRCVWAAGTAMAVMHVAWATGFISAIGAGIGLSSRGR